VSARCTLVIPVYKNEGSIPELLDALDGLKETVGDLEVVLVVDGSPDRCFALLEERLPARSFASTLIGLSRNFGSFCAIHAGLAAGTGEHFAVMAADLQEPPELIADFFASLRARAAGRRAPRRRSSGASTGASCSPSSRRAASTCSAARAACAT
jgi:polyisoprenyl-phosphate glycosyltransferase